MSIASNLNIQTTSCIWSELARLTFDQCGYMQRLLVTEEEPDTSIPSLEMLVLKKICATRPAFYAIHSALPSDLAQDATIASLKNLALRQILAHRPEDMQKIVVHNPSGQITILGRSHEVTIPKETQVALLQQANDLHTLLTLTALFDRSIVRSHIFSRVMTARNYGKACVHCYHVINREFGRISGTIRECETLFLNAFYASAKLHITAQHLYSAIHAHCLLGECDALRESVSDIAQLEETKNEQKIIVKNWEKNLYAFTGGGIYNQPIRQTFVWLFFSSCRVGRLSAAPLRPP